jgi:hypothetical protein
MGGSKPFLLDVTGPDGVRREHAIRRDRILIGSGPLADVGLTGEGVSPAHALLVRTDRGELWLVDLRSDSGTWIDGRRISEVRLAAGQRASIAGWTLAARAEQASRRRAEGDALEARFSWGETLLAASRTARGGEVHFPNVNGAPDAARLEDRAGVLELALPVGWAGRVVGAGGAARPVVGKVALGPGERAEVAAGPLRGTLRPAAPQQPISGGVRLDARFAVELALVALLAIGLGWEVGRVPPEEPERLEALPAAPRMARYAPPSRPPPEIIHPPAKVAPIEAATPEPARPAVVERRARPATAVDPRARRSRALGAGLLAVLGRPGPGVGRLLAGGGIGAALASIGSGAPVAAAGPGGIAGLGGLGSGGAGGSSGGGVLGIGGTGFTDGEGNAPGQATPKLAQREAVRVVPGRTTVLGALTREEIEAVIRRHEGDVRYCYELELQHDPDLHGKLALTWTIGPQGAVQEAELAETTLGGDAQVERCLLERVRGWIFPEPRGGGQVVVTYPWMFKPAG